MYYTPSEPSHLCPIGCCPVDDCQNDGWPIMWDSKNESPSTCHGAICSSKEQAETLCNKLNRNEVKEKIQKIQKVLDEYKKSREPKAINMTAQMTKYQKRKAEESINRE